jgi:Cu2+-containing amine oxidase
VTTTDTAAPPAAAHPLDLLTADEISRAVEIVGADPRFPDEAVFAHVRLHEPPKDVVAAHSAGAAVDREVEALVVPRAGIEPIEVVVSVTEGTVRSWTPRPGMRPALLFGESFDAIVKVREHPDWQAALRRRGIDDFDAVQLDPWPAGSFGVAHEDGRRISRVLSYLRHSKDDNGYAHPIEGVVAFSPLPKRIGSLNSFQPARYSAQSASTLGAGWPSISRRKWCSSALWIDEPKARLAETVASGKPAMYLK